MSPCLGGHAERGEQQRLGFARIFYHKPAFAIMDEATSAPDADLGALVCSAAYGLSILICITGKWHCVAHRLSTRRWLDRAGGRWTTSRPERPLGARATPRRYPLALRQNARPFVAACASGLGAAQAPRSYRSIGPFLNPLNEGPSLLSISRSSVTISLEV